MPARSMPPKPFELERMIAIYSHIYKPHKTASAQPIRIAEQSQLKKNSFEQSALIADQAAASQPYTQVNSALFAIPAHLAMQRPFLTVSLSVNTDVHCGPFVVCPVSGSGASQIGEVGKSRQAQVASATLPTHGSAISACISSLSVSLFFHAASEYRTWTVCCFAAL